MADKIDADDIRQVAAGLRRMLEAIEAGTMTADSGTIARLEGAVAALDALTGDTPSEA